MTSPSRLTHLLIAGLTIGLPLGSIGLASPWPSLAQSRAQSSSRRSRVKFTMPRLSYDRGAPSNRGDGASRGIFCQASTPPIALTPQYSEPSLDSGGNPRLDLNGNPLEKHFVLSQTNAPQPTFAVHLPLGKQDVLDLQLALVMEDTAGNLLYELPITAPEQSGIITFKPGPSELKMQPGQRYDWNIFVEARCIVNDQEKEYYATLKGQMEHQPMVGENMGKEDYAIATASQGFWPDAMATVADLHRQDRSNEQYIADWRGLLTDIGLAQLTTAPLSATTQLLSPQEQANAPEMLSLPVSPQRRPSSRLFPVR